MVLSPSATSINRDELEQLIEENKKLQFVNDLLQKKLHLAETKNVVHAVWIETASGGRAPFRCSNCRRKAGYRVVDRYKYCPN